MHFLWGFQSGGNQRLNSALRCDVITISSIAKRTELVELEEAWNERNKPADIRNPGWSFPHV